MRNVIIFSFIFGIFSPLTYADPIDTGVLVKHAKNKSIEKLLKRPPANQKLAVGFSESFEKVYFSSPHNLSGTIKNTTDVYMAQNEIESVQLLLLPFQNLTDIKISLSDFTHTNKKQIISKQTIEIRPVGYIYQYKTRYKGNAKRWHPDPLFPDQTLKLKKSELQPVLISFDTRKKVAAGNYTGTINIQQGSKTLATATINLHIWNIRLPDKSRFKTSVFARWQSVIDMWPKQLKNDAEIMRQFNKLAELSFKNRMPVTGHFANGMTNYFFKGSDGINYGDTYPNETTYSKFSGWQLKFDTAKTANLIKQLKTNHVNHFFMGFLSNLAQPENVHKRRQQVARNHLIQYSKFVYDNKLTDMAYVYNIDEPWGEKVEIARQQYTEYKKIVGDKIKIMQNTNQHNDKIIPQLIGYFDVLDINLGFYHRTKLESYRKKYPKQLKEVWWNINLWPSTRPNVFIEYPLIDARIIGPMSYKYNIQGFEYWDLFNASTIKESVPLPLNKLRIKPSASWTSLDGTLVYPTEKKTVLSSLRLEAMRDGFEDLELLYLLEKLKPNHPLLKVPVVKDIFDFENSPSRYLQYRKQLADAILRLKSKK